MSQITVNDLTFSYDTTYDNIFEHVSFLIDTDWKLGFIGRNGRGKTTFLKLLMGIYEYKGSITASVNFDYFPFEISDPKLDTMEIIKNTIAPFTMWEQELEECLRLHEGEQSMAHDNQQNTSYDNQQSTTNSNQQNTSFDNQRGIESSEPSISPSMERYGRVLDLYQDHDGYVIEELIEKELGKIKVDQSVLTRAFSTLSFGERTKIMLAALFFKKNNFLLIDEPTNHLDMEGREILADYLQTKKGFILVSHDRSFLDQCIDHVLSINRTNIEVQRGTFSSWQQNKELQDNFELNRNEQLKKDISILNDSARRAMGWSDQIEAGKIGNHVFDRGAVGHKTAKMMKRAKSIENRKFGAIDEKKGLLKNIELKEPLKMNLLSFPNKRLIEAEDLSLFYEERGIASNIDFTLRSGDRLAIRGRNGSGKSSLFKLLLGEQITYTGRYHVAAGLKISYVSQDTSYLNGDLKDFAVRYGLDETIFKTVLHQLDFSRNQFEKDIRDFSGGQKKKVLLAKSLAEPAHVFLWDEPLNFVDVFSRIQIEELILKYQPTMIFIEHDKMFGEKIGTMEIRL
ncbi:MAG TPA: ABC-F type ribosomal protection protein [Mobilitalea sp.]|nr:ABC-F type ribosomal protection protein [Mobilitalea sp.]